MKHWAYNSVFYHIYPLGFCGAPPKNDLRSEPVNRLEKLYQWQDHLKAVKINALYLGPVFESTSHGYDTVDYYHVDRRLGTNETLKKIVSTLHDNGIRVILDGVFNHVGRDFWAFKDVQANGESSKYCGWFHGISFEKRSPYGDPFRYDGWKGHYNLVKLSLRNEDVIQHLFGAVKEWIEAYDIDGLRIDAADCIDTDFLKRLSSHTKNLKKDFWLMGEVVHGDYRKWVNPSMLDSVTNYECYKGLYSSHNDSNYFEIAYSLNRQFGKDGMYCNLPLYSFVDNHDTNRIASQLKNRAHLYPIYLLTFTMPGVPSIYYGSEWGIEGIKINGSDDGLRPSIDLDSMKANDQDLLNMVTRLSEIRHKSKALKFGSYEQLHVSHEQLVFWRGAGNESMIVATNSASSPVALEFEVPFHDGAILKDILNKDRKYKVIHKKLRIDPLHPCWGSILKSENLDRDG